MKTNRRALLQGATGAAAALSISGLSFHGLSAYAQTPIASGGGEIETLRIATSSLPTTFDPQIAGTLASYRPFDLVFDRLMRQDWTQNGKLVPALATSWTQVDDLTLEFKLRDDVLWQDGTPFTAADVKYSYERTIPGTADPTTPYVNFFKLKEVVAVDDHTVRLVTVTPFGGLLTQLVDYVACIVPAVYHAKLGTEAFQQAPIGTGPFKMTKWTPDESMEFTRNDNYWGGASAAKSVVLSGVPEVSTRIAALLNGDADLILDLAPDQIDAVTGGGDFQIQSTVPLNVNCLLLNAYRPPLDKKEIRQALSLAIDRQTVVDTLFGGKGVVPGSLQSSLDPLYIKRAPLAYDPDKAKELLAAGGYNGEELRFTHNVPAYYPLEEEWVSAVASYWTEIGVKTTIIANSSIPDINTKSADQLPFEVRSASVPVYVDSAVTPEFASDTATFPRYSPPGTFKDVIDAVNAAAATTDPEERARKFQTALDLIEEEVPTIVVWTIDRVAALIPNLNWNQSPDFGINLRPSNFSVPA